MLAEWFFNRITAVLRGGGEKTYRAFGFFDKKNSLIEVHLS